MKCISCGAEIADGSPLCLECGADQVTGATEILNAEPEEVASEPEPKEDDSSRSTYDQAVEDQRQKKADEKMRLARYKEAKAAFKQARKAAGKSSAPKVIGIILLMLVCLAAGAAGLWYFWGQDLINENATLQTQLNTAKEELNVLKAENEEAAKKAEAAAAEAAKKQALLGNWKATFDSTAIAGSTLHCNAARSQTLKLTILNADADGTVTLNADFLYHGHNAAQMMQDQQKTDGDTYVSKAGLTGTLTSDVIEVIVDMSDQFGEGSMAKITLRIDQSGDAPKIAATVVSQFQAETTQVITDSYSLTK